ncbi:MAG TPA: hypothetical protein PKV52_01295 [Candidatus Saccharibacteria bacterium]|nr:hypothetical protein [Candidatus Saccharibacteria bacterium]
MSETVNLETPPHNPEDSAGGVSPDEGVDQYGANEANSQEISIGNTITILVDEALHQGTVVDIRTDAHGNVEKYVVQRLDQSDENRYLIAPETVVAENFISTTKDNFETRIATKSEELKDNADKLAEMLYARSGRVVTAKNYTKEQIDESAKEYKEKLDTICAEFIESFPEDQQEQAQIILNDRIAEFKAEYKTEVSRRVTQLRAEKLETLGPVRKKMLDGWKKLSQFSRSDKKWKKFAGIGGKAAVFAPIGVVGALLTPVVGGTAVAVGAVAGATAIARGVARFKLDQLSEESEMHETEAAATDIDEEVEASSGVDSEPTAAATELPDDPESLEKAVQESHDRKKANQKRAALALAVAATAFIGTRLIGEWIHSSHTPAPKLEEGGETQPDNSLIDEKSGEPTDQPSAVAPTDPTETGGPDTGDTIETSGPDAGDTTETGGGTNAPDQETSDSGADSNAPNLTDAQHEFEKSGAKYPWDAAADVYGRENASDALFKAVKAANKDGLNVKWHGSGENAWISVKGNSNGGYVIKQLAQYMPKK